METIRFEKGERVEIPPIGYATVDETTVLKNQGRRAMYQVRATSDNGGMSITWGCRKIQDCPEEEEFD